MQCNVYNVISCGKNKKQLDISIIDNGQFQKREIDKSI